MKYIKQVLEQLEKQHKTHEHEIFNYAVPSLWDHTNQDALNTFYNEKIVNPYTFYYENIKELCYRKKDKNYLLPLSEINKSNTKEGNWIKEAFVYSTMIRTSAAYDHDRDGYITQSNIYELKESGTFLKFMCLLPYLKEMGINTLYLLPFFKSGKHNKKGEFGSCYAVYDYYEIDENLADPMLNMSVEDQFKAFVEMCHMHNIRLIMDIIPRTISITSSYLKKHPDWFYWIDKDYSYSFMPPEIEELDMYTSANKEVLETLYKNLNTRYYLKQFREDPRSQDEKKYNEILEKCGKEHLDFLECIEKEFHCTIAPAFSDAINDPQDVWSDVTYLKMYMDNPVNAKNYISDTQAPYILYDVAKSNLHPGKKENKELWDLLISIIPYYTKQFGIDGVRIDMGHALPVKLIQKIIQKAKKANTDICIIAEEMDVRNDALSKEKGYTMISGNGFSEESRIKERRLHSFYYNARYLQLPVFAMAENHDSLRISAKEGGTLTTDMVTIINMFMPNGIPFLNSGQEFYEIQPMNLGVDTNSSTTYTLDLKDFRNGKMALFDSYCFMYDNERIMDLLKEVSMIRNKYMKEITDSSKSIPAWFDSPNDNALGSWFVKEDKMLLMIANTDLNNNATYNVHFLNVQDKISFMPKKIKDVFSTHKNIQKSELFSNYCIQLKMKPGEVRLLEVK